MRASGDWHTVYRHKLLSAWMGCTIATFPSLCYPLIAQQHRADKRMTGMDYSKYITRGRAVSAFAAAAVEDDQPVPAVPVLA